MTVADTSIRGIAEGRHHALANRDAAVSHVSPSVFWLIWRDGCNWALTSSAKMSTLFQEVGEHMLLLAQAREAAPPVCPHCGGAIE